MDRLTLEVLAAHKPRYPTVYGNDPPQLECAMCAADYLMPHKGGHCAEAVLSRTREAPERAGDPCCVCEQPTEVWPWTDLP